MAKDDFDMDFHFDDDDFDPKAFLDGEDGADIDLSEFDDVPSGGDKLDKTVADGYDDELDLSGLGLDDDSDETVDELDLDDILSPKAVRRNSQEHDDFGTNKQENDSDFDGTEFLDDEDDQTQAAPEDDSDFQSARTSLPAAGRKSLKRPPNRPVSASQRSRRKRSPTSSPSCMTFTLLP